MSFFVAGIMYSLWTILVVLGAVGLLGAVAGMSVTLGMSIVSAIEKRPGARAVWYLKTIGWSVLSLVTGMFCITGAVALWSSF